MPFMYRRKKANIDRSSKRDPGLVSEKMMTAVDELSRHRRHAYIPIIPISFDDPTFDLADPDKFLALYAIKHLGLNLYEVESWLNNIYDFSTSERHLSLVRTSLVLVDERRRYYSYGPASPRSHVKYDKR